jgi:exopolysaccharide production protein ExoZ
LTPEQQVIVTNESASRTELTIGHFEGVQFLRFLAAFVVLLTHSTFFYSTRLNADFPVLVPGAQGVQVFFVISGFVMVITSRRLPRGVQGAKAFMTSRIIRILPLYYALNLAKIIQINVLPSLSLARPDVLNILLSLLFIPSRNAVGKIETFYGVGWTLNFEMLFYLLFSFAILMSWNATRFVGLVLVALAAASLFHRDDWPAIAFFAAPIVLNFLWGMLIAKLVLRGFRVHPAVCIALVSGGLIVFFAAPYYYPLLQLQFAAIVAGVVFLEPVIRGRMPRVFLFGGDASYSLYLVHPLVGVMIVVVLGKLQITAAPVVIGVVIAGALAASALTYLLFEKPVTVWLRQRYR